MHTLSTHVETDSEQSYCELNTVILSGTNDSLTNRIVDGCVVYKTSDDNFLDHSKIIAHTNDTISYTLAESQQLAAVEVVSKQGENIIASQATVLSTSPSLIQALSSSVPASLTKTITTTNNSNRNANNNNNINSSSSHSIVNHNQFGKILSTNEMVMQHHQHHHHVQLIDTDYHHPNSPTVSSDSALMRGSLIYMYPYATVSPPPTQNPHNHGHHHQPQHHQIVHHSNVISSVTTIDDVIADTLKDENCSMIDGLNHSPVLVANVNYNPNSHSTANSDVDDHNSKSPIAGTAAISHSDDYDGNTLQSFTHLTNATDASHAIVSRESVYNGTALLTPNSVTASSSIVHPIQTYESVLHPTTPTR